MTRVLLHPMTECKGLGPISQLLAVAEELTVRGHPCAFVAAPIHAELLTGLGFECFVAPVPDALDPTAPDFRLCHAARALGVTDASYFAKAVDFELSAVELFRPDVMVGALKLSAPITATARGIPLVSIAAWPDSPSFTSPLYPDHPCERLPDHIGDMTVDAYCMCSLGYEMSSYRIAPYAAQFDPFLPPERLTYVGPLLSRGMDLYRKAWHAPDDGRDLVVVYLNRGSQPVSHYLQVLATAARSLPRHHFLVVERDTYLAPDLPDNMSVVPAAPILRLLQPAALYICGGGYNAITAALMTGTPVLGMPGLCAERDFNMRRVVGLGAGRLVPGYPVDEAEAATAVQELLADGDAAAAALATGDMLRNLPGTAGVVGLVQELV